MSNEQSENTGTKSSDEHLGPNAKAQAENINKVKDAAEKLRQTRVRTHPNIVGRLEKMRCWPEVLALLENGEKVNEIARFIHEDRAESTDIQRQSLISTIYYWINKNKEHRNRTPTKHLVLIGSMSENVDALSAINMLFAIQVDRITEHYAVEKEHKNFTNFNNNAIRIAKEIVQTMADIEQKRRPGPSVESVSPKGVNDTYLALQRMGQNYAEKYGINTANVILNDESRRRVLSALEKVRQSESQELVDILKNNQTQAERIRREEEERVRDEAQAEKAEGQVN